MMSRAKFFWRDLIHDIDDHDGIKISPEKARDEWLNIKAAYYEPQRHYHRIGHISNMIESLYLLNLKAGHVPGTVFRFAAFYHDIVYQTNAKSGDNERASVVKLSHSLVDMGLELPSRYFPAASELILLTQHHNIKKFSNTMSKKLDMTIADVARFLDADLSILATQPALYKRYVKGIRAEHHRVPELEFLLARQTFLTMFLSKPCIFNSNEGVELYEEKARANMLYESCLIEQQLEDLG